MTHCPDWTVTDQYDQQSEGLAAKLENANQQTSKSGNKKIKYSSETDSKMRTRSTRHTTTMARKLELGRS